MKKLIIALLALMVLAPACFAKVDSGIQGFGVDVLGGGTPYMRLAMSKDMTVDLGIGFNSTGAVAPAVATSTMGLMARLNSVFMKIGNSVDAYWGGMLAYTSTTAAATFSVLSLSGHVGAEYAINSNVGMYADITLLSLNSNSFAGASTTDFTLLNASGLAYSGIRVYL